MVDNAVEKEAAPKEKEPMLNWVAVALVGLAYLAITLTFSVGGGMPGVGSTAAVTVGSNAASLPYYTLKAYIPTYNTTELTHGATNIGWNAYLTATSYAASEYRVYLVWQAFWTLLVIAGIYLVPAFLYWMYADKLDHDSQIKTQAAMSHATFGLSQLLVFVMVQTNYIVFLGEFSKIASWLAAIAVAVQVSIYYAGAFLSAGNNSQTLELLQNAAKRVGLDVNLTASTGVKIALLILTVFLWWVLAGMCLIIPMTDKGGILYLDPAALRATLVFYLFQQTWALVKFNVVNMSKQSWMSEFFRHNLVTLLEHAGVFSLMTVYVFEALASLYNAGRLN